MNLPGSVKLAESKVSFSHVLLYGLPTEGIAQI